MGMVVKSGKKMEEGWLLTWREKGGEKVVVVR
jgi:hypothetical protein